MSLVEERRSPSCVEPICRIHRMVIILKWLRLELVWFANSALRQSKQLIVSMLQTFDVREFGLSHLRNTVIPMHNIGIVIPFGHRKEITRVQLNTRNIWSLFNFSHERPYLVLKVVWHHFRILESYRKISRHRFTPLFHLCFVILTSLVVFLQPVALVDGIGIRSLVRERNVLVI